MINERWVKKYCCEDITMIENYELALADTTQTWCCHHRDEIRILPSGMTVIRSTKDLIDDGRYYNCPANELIFLTRGEHQKLHMTNINAESKRKMTAAARQRFTDPEQRKKVSDKHKGKTLSVETKKKLSEAMKGQPSPNKGKHWKNENNQRIYY